MSKERTTTSCHVSFQISKNHDTFPLEVIRQVNRLNDFLMRWDFGRYTFSVCGKEIKIQGNSTYTVKPYNSPGPWKEMFVTRIFEDKRVVIALMALVIMLENTGYIYGLNVTGIDEQGNTKVSKENQEMWETAWSIFLSLAEGGDDEYTNV